MNIEFFFFRDLTSEGNLKNGREYHAAGIVVARYGTNSQSGKDVAVTYLNPFNCCIENAWRSDNEIEIYEVDEWEWKIVKDRYDFIEANDEHES